jgi:hypothetical protein
MTSALFPQTPLRHATTPGTTAVRLWHSRGRVPVEPSATTNRFLPSALPRGMMLPRRSAATAFALGLLLAAPLAASSHNTGCPLESADPATYNVFFLPWQRYVEERNVPPPLNPVPPIAGTGAAAGDGTWIYDETNGVPGLQRGGAMPGGLLVDPLLDENCDHGPDSLVGGGGVSSGPKTPFTFAVNISRTAPGTPPVVNALTPGCTSAVGADDVTVTCTPPSGTWDCLNPAVSIVAVTGTVSATSACANSPVASAAVPGPGLASDVAPGSWNHDYTCTADFGAAGTGTVVCLS